MANISRLLTGILKGADKTAKKILVDALEDPANLTGKGEIRKDTLTALAEKEGLSRNLKDLISAAKDNTGARQLIGDFKTGRRKIGEDEPGGFKVYQDAAREVKTGETPEAFTARRKKEGKEKGKKVFEFLKNMPEDLRPKEKGEKYSVIRDLARIQTKARKQEKIQKDLDNILKKAYKEGTFVEDPRYAKIINEYEFISKALGKRAFANIVKDNPDIAKKIKDPKFKSAIEKGYKELIEDAGLFIEKGADKSRFKSLINPVRLNALVKAAKETNYIPKGKNKTDPFFSNKNIKNRLGFNKPIDEFTIGPKRGISPLRFPDLPEGSDPNQLALQEARKSLATTRALDLAVDPRMPGPKEAVSAKQMAEIMRGGDPAFRTLEVTRTGPRGTIEPDAELLAEYQKQAQRVREFEAKYPGKPLPKTMRNIDPRGKPGLLDIEEMEAAIARDAERGGVFTGQPTVAPRSRRGTPLAEEVTKPVEQGGRVLPWTIANPDNLPTSVKREYYQNLEFYDSLKSQYLDQGFSVAAAEREAKQDFVEAFGEPTSIMYDRLRGKALTPEEIAGDVDVPVEGRTRLLAEETPTQEAEDLLNIEGGLDQIEDLSFRRGGLISLVKKRKKKRPIPKIIKNKKLKKRKQQKPRGVGQALRGYGATNA
jgi:hypothetical protein|tara:strand:+ start:923 stop:2881 length:1959 start_codon:yes stop_codon:yes gene_type:complete